MNRTPRTFVAITQKDDFVFKLLGTHVVPKRLTPEELGKILSEEYTLAEGTERATFNAVMQHANIVPWAPSPAQARKPVPNPQYGDRAVVIFTDDQLNYGGSYQIATGGIAS